MPFDQEKYQYCVDNHYTDNFTATGMDDIVISHYLNILAFYNL